VEDSCQLRDVALGYLIGQATATALDAVLLARWSTFQPSSEPRPVVPSETRQHGVTFVPRVVATPQLGLVGVGGTFY
jgi:hypothetical protein